MLIFQTTRKASQRTRTLSCDIELIGWRWTIKGPKNLDGAECICNILEVREKRMCSGWAQNTTGWRIRCLGGRYNIWRLQVQTGKDKEGKVWHLFWRQELLDMRVIWFYLHFYKMMVILWGFVSSWERCRVEVPKAVFTLRQERGQWPKSYRVFFSVRISEK